jgi:hypothetical protein
MSSSWPRDAMEARWQVGSTKAASDAAAVLILRAILGAASYAATGGIGPPAGATMRVAQLASVPRSTTGANNAKW